jgi:hypothetical protein
MLLLESLKTMNRCIAFAFSLFAALSFQTLPFVFNDNEAHAAEQLQKPRKAKMHILAVGVSKFSDPFWPTLKWAESDASTILKNIGADTEYQAVNVSLLNEKATLQELRKRLDEIKKSASADDVVFVYISSHGTLKIGRDNTLEPVVVLHDTLNSNLGRTSFSHAEMRNWISRLKSRRKAVVFATCHSGVGKSRYTSEVAEFRRGEKGGSIRSLDKVSEGSVILAASSRNETALESDDLKADVYSHFFVEALASGDRDNDGSVSLLEAHDHAKARTYAFTKGRQRPTLDAEMIGDADFALKGQRQRDGKPVLEAWSQKYEGYSVGVAKGVPVELPLAIPLEEGKNEISVYSPDEDEPRRFALNIARGERISLQKILAPPPYYASYSIAIDLPDDSRIKKLTGSSALVDHGVAVGGEWQNWDAFARLAFDSTSTKEVREGISATLKVSKWGGGISRVLHLGDKFAFRLGIHGQRVTSNLKFQDDSTLDSQSNEARSLRWGWWLDSTFKFNPSIPLKFSLGRGQAFERRVFETFGVLPMNTTFMTAGLLWEFGSPAREL